MGDRGARRWASGGVAFSLVGVINAGVGIRPARAGGEATPAVFVTRAIEGKRTQRELASETIDVGLQSHTVKDLQIKSVIEDADGEALEAAEVGKSIISRNPGMSLQPDVVVAKYGDLVSIPRPHKRELAPGTYAETVRLEITDSDYSAPVVVSRTRFFQVWPDGAVETVDSEAYSRVVDGRGRLVRGRDGAALQVHDGRGFAATNPKATRLAQPRFAVDGRIENLDAEVKLPAVPAEPAADESKED
jgi:hypothetical protein